MKKTLVQLVSLAVVLGVIVTSPVFGVESKGGKYYVGKVMAMDAIQKTITITEYNSNTPVKFFLTKEVSLGDVFIGDEVVIVVDKKKKVRNIQRLEGEEQAVSRMPSGRKSTVLRGSGNFFDPFEEMSRMKKVMNRMFNDSFGRGIKVDSDMLGGLGVSFDPAIDVKEQDDSYVVVVDLPGVEKDTINISAQPNSVTISGERSMEKEQQDNTTGFYRAERSFGSFQRTIPLMERIVPNQVTAETTEGVLVIKLPKETKTGTQIDQGTTVKVQ